MGQVQTNGRPIETTPVPPGTPSWGAKWKKAVAENYLSTLKRGTHARQLYSYRDVYLDLDPTYKDRFGRPLMRMTFDFHDNELKQDAIPDRQVRRDRPGDGRQAGREGVRARALTTSPSTRPRICGGAIMGTDPEDQRAQPLSAELGRAEPVRDGRDAPSRRTPATTRPARSAALAFWAADAIREQYLKNPGPLVDA